MSRSSDGNTPPLGAEVFDSKEIAIGAVGQGGLLYARVPTSRGFTCGLGRQ